MPPGFIELSGMFYLYAAGALAGVWLVLRRRRRARGLRRGQPGSMSQHLPDGHSSLNPKLAAEQKLMAERIVATASSGLLPGYDIVRQIEAVYVDGFRHPEEALVGLKAAAAMKGANAVIHVHHERTAAGRCTASGDAVLVRAVESGDSPSDSPPTKDKS